jgi:hypothetical protein
MKIKDLPERLKDLAIVYMNGQGHTLTDDSTVRDIYWSKTLYSTLFCTLDLYFHGGVTSVSKEALQQLRTIYPNDQEFGEVVAKLFLS